jgi:hypothetical protein
MRLDLRSHVNLGITTQYFTVCVISIVLRLPRSLRAAHDDEKKEKKRTTLSQVQPLPGSHGPVPTPTLPGRVPTKVLGFISQKISEPTELDEIRKIRKIRTGIHSKFEWNLSKFEQNFSKLSGMPTRLQRVHAAPVGNVQVAGRAATMWWWQQAVKMAATTHEMRWRHDGEHRGAAMAHGWRRGVYLAQART